MSYFISEDDLKSFEKWLEYQGYDHTMLASDDLAKWRLVFNDLQSKPNAKVGLMKLGARVPGDGIYAVAVRDSGLWLTLWVRRSWKSGFLCSCRALMAATRLGFPRGPHDFGSAMSIGRQKDNLRSPNVLLWAVAVGHHRLKLIALGGTQLNVRSLVHLN
jgi:hypothetical protein